MWTSQMCLERGKERWEKRKCMCMSVCTIDGLGWKSLFGKRAERKCKRDELGNKGFYFTRWGGWTVRRQRFEH